MSYRKIWRNSCSILCMFLLVLHFIGDFSIALAHADTCANLIPEESDFGYKQLNNRCEGFYAPKLRGHLQVVSFTLGDDLKFNWKESTRLTVTPMERPGEPVKIRAVSLQRNIFYRLDAVLTGDSSLDWPIGPYLYPRNIRPDQLGVYGWTGKEDDKIFLPVIVREQESPLPNVPTLTLKIRTVLDLTHFRWTLIDSRESVCQSQPGINTFEYYNGDMNAGKIITIKLTDSANNVYDGCLEIQYRPNNKRWKSEIINIRF